MAKPKQIIVVENTDNPGEASAIEVPNVVPENLIETEVQLSGPPQEVRVLVDCPFGRCNEVVTLTQAQIRAGLAAGQIDPDPDAVTAAQS